MVSSPCRTQGHQSQTEVIYELGKDSNQEDGPGGVHPVQWVPVTPCSSSSYADWRSGWELYRHVCSLTIFGCAHVNQILTCQ